MPVYKDTPQNRKLNRVGKPYGKDLKTFVKENEKSFAESDRSQKANLLVEGIALKLEEQIKELESDINKNTEYHQRLIKNLEKREKDPIVNLGPNFFVDETPSAEDYAEVKKLLDKINSDTEKIKKKTEQILIARRDKKDIPKKEKVYYEKLILAIPDQTVVAKTLSTKVPKQEQNPQLNKALKRLEALRKKPKSIIISTLIKEQDFIIRKLREIARIANLRKKIK